MKHHTTTSTAPHVCPVERAGGLDHWMRKFIQPPKRIVGEFIKSGDTIIDIGCGPGYFTFPMAELAGPYGRTIAVDMQQGMLDIVQQKAGAKNPGALVECHLCESDAIDLNVQADFILAYYMVHETPSHRAFFKEVRTMLKPDGTILVVEPPFHVKKAAFEAMLAEAKESGLRVIARPKRKGGPAALLGL